MTMLYFCPPLDYDWLCLAAASRFRCPLPSQTAVDTVPLPNLLHDILRNGDRGEDEVWERAWWILL